MTTKNTLIMNTPQDIKRRRDRYERSVVAKVCITLLAAAVVLDFIARGMV